MITKREKVAYSAILLIFIAGIIGMLMVEPIAKDSVYRFWVDASIIETLR